MVWYNRFPMNIANAIITNIYVSLMKSKSMARKIMKQDKDILYDVIID